MSYEINVLVVNQVSSVQLNFISSIELENEIDNEGVGRYYDMWPFLMKTKGILYYLGADWKGSITSFAICDADFDAKRASKPYWVTNKHIRRHLRPFVIKPEFRIDFEKIIRFLIEQSPEKTILFQTRYQGGDDEIICGVLSPDEYFKLLDKNKILFNTCYIIRPLESNM